MVARVRDTQGGVTRRTFLATSAGASVLFAVGSVLPGCSREEPVSEVLRNFTPSMWLEISGDGAITFTNPKAEMGQHVGTALARVMADELGANWSDVSIRHADSDPGWFVLPLGNVTGGSWSVFFQFTAAAQAGAAARTILCEAGAAMLGVEPGECTVEGSMVSARGAEVSFADIVQQGDISRTMTGEEMAALPVKSPGERRLIGKSVRALDVEEKSMGKAVYGIDAELPGMVYAHPVMPPTRYGSVITSLDDSAAKAIPGYQQTLQLEDPSEILQGWAVVIADNFPAAMKAAKAVNVEWEPGPTSGVTEAHIQAEAEKLCADKSSGTLFVDDGDVAAAQDAAAQSFSATYRTSTVLHFTLEPANALVEVVDGKYHIHSGNQWHSLILPTLAAALETDQANITIHQYYLGGGFGRRLWGDQMIPAALAAKALGKPVKLVFSRPEDSRFDCVRSPSVQQFDASFDADGNLTGIEHAAAAGWPTGVMAPGALGTGVDGEGKWDPFSINSADHWYTLPAHRVRAIRNELAERTFHPGWLRAVGPGWIGWGLESFMDELAVQTGQDPIEMRIAMLDGAGKHAGDDHGTVGGANRLRAVLEDVRDRSGWGGELPEGEALGVAVTAGQERNMGTWIGCVAHVAVDPATKAVEVKKIWQTIDCGTVVHPEGAMSQAEGACLWGVSLALHEGTVFKDGQVADQNLDTYTPLRIDKVPELDIKFVESTEFPTGLGEPPLIPVAPAIANAIFAASGIRVRDLPIRI